jgi:CheY-like chemotaxis protein
VARNQPSEDDAGRLDSEIIPRAGFEAWPEGVPSLRGPVAAPAPPTAARFLTAGAPGVSVSGGGGRIDQGLSLAAPRALVVDDDPEVRRALARLLRPELDVHLAGSVVQAEALLARLDRVDLAFVDWELPDGTGEQILERLAAWPDAIRVLISARLSSGGAGLGGVPSSQASRSENPLKNRSLANLVLGKPVARGVVDALKLAALALPQD